jgi:hypothetical protein
MRRLAWLPILLSASLLSACVPERVVWSPDGSRAALLAPDGLHLMDPDGKVGPLLMEGVSRTAWLPDGQRLAIATSLGVTGWEELVKTIPGAKANPALAEKVKAALTAAAGSWERFEVLTREIPEDDRAQALLYLRDNDPKLPDAAGALWPNVVDTSYSVPIFHLLEVSNPAEPSVGPILFYGSQGRTLELRVAPGGEAVALTLTSHRDKSPDAVAPTLCIASTRKGEPPLTVDLANTYVDWSADGKAIVYLRPNGNTAETAKTGTLSRQVVFGIDGQLLTKEKLPPREDLLQVTFHPDTRVRCIKDGRIFFTTPGALVDGLPASTSEKPDLYCLEPGPTRTLKRLITVGSRGKAGDALQYFAPNPDGTHIALPFGDGRLSLLTVSSGEVTFIENKTLPGMKNELTSAPTWRGNTELTFPRPPADGSRVRELVRYHIADGTAVNLSKDWPDDLRRDWLIPTPDDPQAGNLP